MGEAERGAAQVLDGAVAGARAVGAGQDAAGKNRPIRHHTLPGHLQAELIDSSRRQNVVRSPQAR